MVASRHTSELRATFTARGSCATEVMDEARRIAAQVFPGIPDVWVSYGPLTPHLTARDGTGHSTVQAWEAECEAQAMVPDA